MKEIINISEEQIIQRIKENDEKIIETVYTSNYQSVMHYVILNNGTIHQSKDIYQDAFIVFLNKLKDPEFKLVCKIKTYLYSVARRLWLIELTKQKIIVKDIHDTETYISFDREEETSLLKSEKNFEAMHKSLEELGGPCNTILTDFYIYKKKMAEIVEKMGYTNADNAKNQKYKCLKRLKTIFFKNLRK